MTADPSVWVPPTGPELTDWLTWASSLPLCRSLGIVCIELDVNRGVFTVADTPLTPNPNGSVNGGIVAAIADQAMGVMAVRGAPVGHLPATAALHSQFHSPAWAPLTVRAEVLGGGRRVRFVEVAVFDKDGNRCVTSHGTMVVSRNR